MPVNPHQTTTHVVTTRRLASVHTMRMIALSTSALIAIAALVYFDARIPYANISIIDQWNAIIEAMGVTVAYLMTFALILVSSPNYQHRSRR